MFCLPRSWQIRGGVVVFLFLTRHKIFAVLKQLPAALGVVLEVLKDDPLFQTGYPWVDTTLAVIFYGALSVSSYIVLYQLLDSWNTASIAEEARRRRSKNSSKNTDQPQRRHIRWREIKLFLIATVIILVFVHTLRFKHRSIKLSSFKLQQGVRDTGKAFKKTELSDFLPDSTDVKGAAYKYAYCKLPDWLVEKVPWLPHDWSRNASVWSYFRLLIDESRRNWWTRQWVMGFSAWSVFVAIESVNRGYSSLIPLSYILLGYCTSLSAMQFIFFAQLLLEPRKALDEDHMPVDVFWVPSRLWVLGLGVIETFCLVTLPTLRQWMSDASSDAASIWGIVFGFVQLVLILAPFISAISDEIGNDHTSPRYARKSLSYAWCILSMISAALHVRTSVLAFREANPDELFDAHSRWGQIGWLNPWQNHHYLAKDVGSMSWKVVEELGDHPWINAVAWDVVFSGIGLAIWSVISSANVRDMLQCTFMPWLDDIEDAVKDKIEDMQEIAEQVASIVGSAVSRAGSVAHDARDKVVEAADQLQELAEPAIQQAKDTAEDVREMAAPVVESARKSVLDSLPAIPELPKPSGRLRSPVKRSSRADSGIDEPVKDTQDDRRSSRRNACAASQRSTSASHSREARGHSPAQAKPRRGRSAGLRGGHAGPAGRDQSFSSTASEVVDAASDVEAAGVTWVLFMLGGLGVASAGVFGADQI